MIAFAVDMGWMTHTQNQLQSAADAAALAGAGQLADGFASYYLPGQTNARKQVILSASTACSSAPPRENLPDRISTMSVR